MKNEKDTRRFYLLEAFHKGCATGDAYITDDMLFSLSKEMNKSLTSAKFREDLSRQLYAGTLHREGRRIYDRSTWRYEESAAKDLSAVLQHPGFPAVELPDTLMVGGIALCEEQRKAVVVALSHRLTLIMGGAGCGKSTLIRAICD